MHLFGEANRGLFALDRLYTSKSLKGLVDALTCPYRSDTMPPRFSPLALRLTIDGELLWEDMDSLSCFASSEDGSS